MVKPKALILTGYGINCNQETELAFQLAGAEAKQIHINDIITKQYHLSDFDILALPGGFSWGDYIGAGKVLANKLTFCLRDELLEFIEQNGLVLGICNGWQVLVKMGLLPWDEKQTCTLTTNQSGRFEDRWLNLEINEASKCIFTRGLETLYLPIRCASGKFIANSKEVVERLEADNQIVVRYAGEDPTGSMGKIAGVCDETGRVFGMMPHPENFIWQYTHPRWTREELPEEGQGLGIFKNAVRYLEGEADGH